MPITSNRSQKKNPQMTATEQSEPDHEQVSEGCQNTRGMVYVNTITGQMVPARCARNSCAYCVQGNARRRARAIALAAPERGILLTQVGNEWQLVRERMFKLKYFLEKEIEKPLQWVYHVEPNPKGTGHHVHAWERGAYIPQKVLSQVASRVGMGGFARISKVKSVRDSSNYGLKGLGYGMKGVEAKESQAAYLVANGRRLTHQSRRFFLDSDGQPCGVKDAEKAASGAAEEAPGTWILMAEG